MITLATLMYEIALTRIFSVTMWHHFAFVAIAVALFGMTIGALLVYLLPAPFSLLMGMPFAIGMRAATSRPNAPTAFLWGINGATSVCASVFGMVIALFFGIAAAFWSGFLAHAIATASMAVIARSRPDRLVVLAEAAAATPEPAPVGAVRAQA